MNLIEGAAVLVAPHNQTRRCFVISGSVHGNEPVGARAIEKVKELLAAGEWKIEGAVYTLIGNPKAVIAGTRFCEENLNRAFGRSDKPGSYESLRAQEIMSWFSELAAEYSELYLIDLHSVSTGNTRIVIFNVENPRAIEWAREVSTIPFAIAEKDSVLPGALTNAWEALGGTAVVIECGNHVAEEGTTVALEHIEKALVSLGMLENPTPSFVGLITYEGLPRTYELRAPIKPRAGFTWEFPVSSEMPLTEGQQYAHDDFGVHTAPENCFIMMPTKVPEPTDFDAGFLAIRTD